MTRPSHATHTGALAQGKDASTGPGCKAKPARQRPFQPTLQVRLPRAAGNVGGAQLDPGSR